MLCSWRENMLTQFYIVLLHGQYVAPQVSPDEYRIQSQYQLAKLCLRVNIIGVNHCVRNVPVTESNL